MARRSAPAGHPAVLCDEPDATDDRSRAEPGTARLQGASDGPVLSGLPRGRLTDDLRRRPRPDPRATEQVVEEGCRGVAEVERLVGRHRRCDGPAAHPGAAGHRLTPAVGPGRPGQAQPGASGGHRAHHRRHHPAAHDEHRRPARRLVRIATDQGRAGGQRRHRNVGRAVRTGYRLCDGSSFDRRCRRRPARQLGLPRGRHGCGLRRDRALGPRLRSRDPHQAQGPATRSSATEGYTARCWTTATRYAPLVVTTLHPKTAFLDQIPHAELPDDFVRDIEHWKTRSGVVKINLALGELPNFTADPSSGLAEHHTGSVEMAPTVDYIEAAFQERPAGTAGPDAVQRRCHPHHPGHHAQSRWNAHHVAVHTVGARRVERRSARRGTRRLRRPAHRSVRPGGAELRPRSPTATSSARTRWSRSTD